MVRKYKVTHKKQLDRLAGEILSGMHHRIFAFSGNLGAGKTTFIKSFCRFLGVKDTVQSPTFSIINEYRTGKGDPVYHMDFYRIQKTEEVFDIGYEEYFFSGNYCFIEWPEKIRELLPRDSILIGMEDTGGETRRITVHFPGE